MFSFIPKSNFNFSVTVILSSANALNLDQSKNVLFQKELKPLTNNSEVATTMGKKPLEIFWEKEKMSETNK